ncbi:hypothetical protein CONLIGDRAFT_633054 [Coniochaeta ligniaria NRRL 30616]|uniref:Uncharacterized protein n=1 Tax=Coniochaeta ligniaria NRRL 30616 TaxID=1408157 RepID=A0A1J7IMP2_9PEZI|nr:hypothetical protein CONLIGDRAFT_633054 [Coniochaeta ligniaria NRRL 30616]
MLTLHPEGHSPHSSIISLSGFTPESNHACHRSQSYTSPSMARTKPSHNKVSPSKRSSADEKVVAQALETARDSDEGAHDPQVCSILEDALSRIWNKIQAQPDSYVMSQTEMSVFTYFQYSFTGNELAVAARKRYWDNIRA